MTRSITILTTLLLALAVGASAVTAAPVAGGETAQVAKRRARACPRGKKRVTVRRNGRRVSRCVKRRATRRIAGPVDPTPPPSPPPAGLFEPPGQRLAGEAAKPFLARYLLDSRFTNCPQGWGVAGCSVEERYSHHGDGSWYYCRLTPTSGADIRSTGSYTIQNAVVEADGSWAFDEIVIAYGSQSAYEWHVATNGVVTGRYSYNGSVEQLGPFQYVQGPRDCGY